MESRTPVWTGPTTVEQLARLLGAELRVVLPGAPEPEAAPELELGQPARSGPEPGRSAELELAELLVRSRVLDRVSDFEQAGSSSLIFVEDARTLEAAVRSRAGAILLSPPLFSAASSAAGLGAAPAALLIVEQPRLVFARAALLLRRAPAYRGVHSSAQIAGDARLGPRVTVGALAVIESGVQIGQGSEIGAGAVLGAGVVVGAECRIYPRAVLYPGARLGDRVVVHAGAVLGSDGFGYVRDRETGAYFAFPQQGTLVIEDDVEIGANTTVDRGALAETRIARGTKLDNLVHVGHNVRVEADVVIAAQTGISGSSTIGRGAVIAGQVGIADHVEIGEGVILGAQGGVPSGKRLRGAGILFWGTPARPIGQYLKELAMLARLTRARGSGPAASDLLGAEPGSGPEAEPEADSDSGEGK